MGTELDNSLLDDILQQVRPLIGRGKVADYIPALAEVSPDHLGIAVCTTKGEIFRAGDANTRFSIQSISKVLSLTLALTRYQESEIWQRVGKEPSGQPFNSLVQLDSARNAGSMDRALTNCFAYMIHWLHEDYGMSKREAQLHMTANSLVRINVYQYTTGFFVCGVEFPKSCL